MVPVKLAHYILSMPEVFTLYTEHANLVLTFDPLAIHPDLGRASVRKLLRRAARFWVYNPTCTYISGARNIYADLLGRWTMPATTRRLFTIPELSSASAEDS